MYLVIKEDWENMQVTSHEFQRFYENTLIFLNNFFLKDGKI